MCGIVGILAFRNSNFKISETYVDVMRDTLAHRGPDGRGTWISEDRRVALGHRRLSILDLSASAAQPMCNEDGSLWISFNGEIYNHRDIRSELMRSRKHRWKTDHSDTEVILHAFEEWGIDCLERFRGMFAIALWDAIKRELWLIRDRIGIKPLYYNIYNGRIVFASEIKAILKDPCQKRNLNEEGFYHFLSFLTTPAPQTLFSGVKKVRPATWLKIKEDGQVQEHKYWDVWDHTTPLTGVPEARIAESISTELSNAVRLRKVSDVPVGVFLSGGIDSSTNTALFSEEEAGPVRTFCIAYDRDYRSYRNENSYARMVAEQIGAIYHERRLSINDLLRFLPDMIYLQDEPIADPVCVPLYYVSKLARDNGVTVCQVGEGADELFWGYPEWKRTLWLQRFNGLPVPGVFKHFGLRALQAFGKKTAVYYEWLRRGSACQPVFWGGAEAFSEMEKKSILSRRLQKKFAGFTSWEVLKPLREHFENRSWERSHVNWMTYLDLNLRLPELLLMRVDKMSMGVSLEARVPFLDHKFVELALSIPSPLKLKGGVPKYILKKAVRGIIPDEVIDRKKQGFDVPVHEWLSEGLGDLFRREMAIFLRETDYFEPAAVYALLEKGRGAQAWYLLNFVLWWKQFIST